MRYYIFFPFHSSELSPISEFKHFFYTFKNYPKKRFYLFIHRITHIMYIGDFNFFKFELNPLRDQGWITKLIYITLIFLWIIYPQHKFDNCIKKFARILLITDYLPHFWTSKGRGHCYYLHGGGGGKKKKKKLQGLVKK